MAQRPLVPGFLKKLDNYLLINKPAVWSARTHLALWYSLLFAAALALTCFVVPFDARENSDVAAWVLFVSVIIGINVIGWLIYLLRFNVFKKFGHLPAAYGIKTFLLYAVVIGSFIAWAYIPAVVESIRANQAYTNEEIVRDINTANLDLCLLERDSLELKWGADTCIVRKDTVAAPEKKEQAEASVNLNEVAEEAEAAEEEPDTAVKGPVSTITLYYAHSDAAVLQKRLASADSVIRPNDSTYVFYECPTYNFMSFDADAWSRVKLLSSVDIYNKVLKNYRKPNRAAVRKQLDSIRMKYNREYELASKFYYPRNYHFNRGNYIGHTQSKYGMYDVSSSMNHITDKKYRWENRLIRDYVRPFYYIVFILTLLVFIFRHTTVKTFFLSVLAAIILLILTSLVFAFTRFRGGSQSVYWVMLVYFLLFAVVAFTIGIDRVRYGWKGIALNLFVFSLPYIPLIIVAQYYDCLREKYYSYEHPEKFLHKELHTHLAEAGGLVLVLLLLDIVIKPLYRKWYALPEQ